MTKDQAADILDVTEGTVMRYVREGLIRLRYWGNVRPTDLDGKDVQKLNRLRVKYGVREGMRRARGGK
jgi:predicted site-specific integrase-resolvase